MTLRPMAIRTSGCNLAAPARVSHRAKLASSETCGTRRQHRRSQRGAQRKTFAAHEMKSIDREVAEAHLGGEGAAVVVREVADCPRTEGVSHPVADVALK